MIQSLDGLRPLVLNIGRASCGRDWNFSDIQSPFTRVYFITAGTARVITPTAQLTLRPGCMYIIPAFTPHSCRCDEHFEHIYIHLYNEGAAYVLEDWEFPAELEASDADIATALRLMQLCPGMELNATDPRWYDNTPTLRSLISVNKSRPFADRLESRGLILQLLSRFLQKALTKTYALDERIAGVLGHIRAHLAEPLELETLSSLAHMSRDHLIRLFKKELGTTPRAYINSKRIEQAQLMLVTEDMAVKEIAFALGFEDQAYFNRLFRRHTGMTPLAYRHSTTI